MKLNLKQELQTDTWSYVDLRANPRKLNKILNLEEIQQEYHNAAIAYNNVCRYELLLDGYDPKVRNLSNEQGQYIRPADVDSCDWRFDKGPGRKPLFWEFTCHSACHWLTQPNFLVAQQLLPTLTWQIASSPFHTTVLNLEHKLLFDLNYVALEVSVSDAIKLLLKTNEDFSLDFYEDGFDYNYLDGLAGPANHIFNAYDQGIFSDETIKQAAKMIDPEVSDEVIEQKLCLIN